MHTRRELRWSVAVQGHATASRVVQRRGVYVSGRERLAVGRGNGERQGVWMLATSRRAGTEMGQHQAGSIRKSKGSPRGGLVHLHEDTGCTEGGTADVQREAFTQAGLEDGVHGLKVLDQNWLEV